jgi:hypothetical protein
MIRALLEWIVAAIRALGHSHVYTMPDGRPIAFCRICGHYRTRRP